MKLTFDEALERINDQHIVDAKNVQARALNRTIWVAEWHLPGCLSETQSYCLTKAEAIETCLMYADSPRAMKTMLQKYGRFDSRSPMFGTCVNTVEKYKLRDLL